ncbi:MAG: DNA/RNA nuclease SfsA [archaeon]|nr:DNA/RNA nuclease SfsA [archaeon]
MRYGKTVTAVFSDRPNRFIAHCILDGETVVCHVKNTGRCAELLLKGVKVVLSVSDNPKRSTGYDLVAVYKGDRLVNIDSQAPNMVVRESFGRIMEHDRLVPEYTLGESRFDFYAEKDDRRILVEVKGVTKEVDGMVMFPDAPTERGRKHVRELTRLVTEGYECWVVFVIQMGDVTHMVPDYTIDPLFGEACVAAYGSGVRFAAFDCDVREDGFTLGRPVPFSPYRP